MGLLQPAQGSPTPEGGSARPVNEIQYNLIFYLIKTQINIKINEDGVVMIL